MSVTVDDPLFNAKLLMSFGPPKHSAEDITTVQTYITQNKDLFKTVNADLINLIVTMNSNPTAGGYVIDLVELIKKGEDPNSEKFNLAVKKFKELGTILPKSDFDVTNAPKLNVNEIMKTLLPKLNLTESEMNNFKNAVQGRPPSPPPSKKRIPGQAYLATEASKLKILSPTATTTNPLPRNPLPRNALPRNALPRNALPRTTPNALPPTPNALPPTPTPTTTLNEQRGGFLPILPFVIIAYLAVGAVNLGCHLTDSETNPLCEGVSGVFDTMHAVLMSPLYCLNVFLVGGRKKSRRRQNKSKQRRQNKSRRRRQK